MKILYFGTICNKQNYERMLSGFKVKPSIAPFVFESALLKGFKDNGADIDVVSFPVIPAFPKSKHIYWGSKKETLESGYNTRWLRTVNISGLKQLCQRISSHIMLKKWLKSNKNEEKAVLIYSAYQPISKSITSLCKKYGTKCYAIIPDLPRDMYNLARVNRLKKSLSKFYVNAAEKIQSCFNGYIYLTDAMKEVINPTAPYTVVEGIANVSEAKNTIPDDKESGFVIMYAGTLNEKYGIRNLIEAFITLKRPDAKLWIFGSGDFQDKISEYANKDNRIKFFGRMEREKILEYERKATLLANVRNDNDEYTKYSFPSKVIEYMLSGTPMLMTKLSGIPSEYYNYVYYADDNKVETLSNILEEISQKSSSELFEFGKQAQAFIKDEKNSQVQANKILTFIKQQQG